MKELSMDDQFVFWEKALLSALTGAGQILDENDESDVVIGATDAADDALAAWLDKREQMQAQELACDAIDIVAQITNIETTSISSLFNEETVHIMVAHEKWANVTDQMKASLETFIQQWDEKGYAVTVGERSSELDGSTPPAAG